MIHSADRRARLVLGTVQMGLPYGIANRRGQPDAGAVADILSRARAAGVLTLDTAAAYGEAEAVLGRAGLSNWQVITKVPSLGGLEPKDAAVAARDAVLASRDKLRVTQLHAVLLHDAADATGPVGRAVADTLAELQAEGVIEKIGVSIYRGVDLEQSPVGVAWDIVQAPMNPLDQRLIHDGTVAALSVRGSALHARSLFLQGLLLMAPEDRPVCFARWASALGRFDACVAQHQTDPLAFCLGFALSAEGVERMVVGVETAEQLDGILRALDRAPTGAKIADLACNDPALLEPRLWGKS